MQIAYSMDCSAKSYSYSAMPSELAQMLPLRAVSCGMFDCGSGYYTRRSGLANYLLIYTLEGEGELDWGQGVHTLSPGMAAVVDCMHYHRYATASGGQWRFYFVHFQGQMEGFAPLLTRRGGLMTADRAAFEAQFEQLIAAVCEATPGGAFVCNLALTQMLTMLTMNGYDACQDEKGHLPEIRRCVAYLRKNFAQPITLGDMAAQMHMSQYHFIRVFEAYMHTTPYAYLLSLRINMSHELLTLTDESVQEIARRVGMRDCNAFIRAFKKRFGQTPEAYRRSFRGMEGEGKA